jgi:Domain of unknown function (DUF932)
MRVNRNRNNEPLSNDQIQKYAPSAFAGQAHDSRSERYAFIPTSDVISALRESGFAPVFAMQSRSSVPGKQFFTKHLLRFRSLDQQLTQVGDTTVELAMTNSHDGTSQYEFSLGAFRLACLNGMMVSEGMVETVKVRHTGNVIETVIEKTRSLIQQAPVVLNAIREWKNIFLSNEEQLILAESALALRFEDNPPIAAAKLLEVFRSADNHNDLWTVFNRIQENTVRGGQRYYSDVINPETQLVEGTRRNRTREVKGIDQNTKLNRELWAIADKMAALKTK